MADETILTRRNAWSCTVTADARRSHALHETARRLENEIATRLRQLELILGSTLYGYDDCSLTDIVDHAISAEFCGQCECETSDA